MPNQSAERTSSSSTVHSSGSHDFDFFVGEWLVQHRRLKERLVNNREWQEFSGTTSTRLLMGGLANVDDNVLNLPSGTYRAVTLRSFDSQSAQWSIWWLDGRSPLTLDTPVRGQFKDGVGTFYAADNFNGQPIRVRFIWSHITPTICQWEQAFSADDGGTWETNWIMNFTRVANC
jgi:hypothetical protein